MKKSFIFLLVCLFIFSCSKEKSKKWIVFDVHVKNKVNLEPVPATFELVYYTNGLLGEDHKTYQAIGSSATGELKGEYSVPRSSYSHELIVKSPVNAIPGLIYTGGRPVSKKAINEMDILLNPTYIYSLNFQNVNCFDETDSLWFTGDDHDVYSDKAWLVNVGCNDFFSNSGWKLDSLLVLNYVVKKNGVKTEHTITETISWEGTPIVVEY
jgi:hypothetical protein